MLLSTVVTVDYDSVRDCDSFRDSVDLHKTQNIYKRPVRCLNAFARGRMQSRNISGHSGKPDPCSTNLPSHTARAHTSHNYDSNMFFQLHFRRIILR